MSQLSLYAAGSVGQSFTDDLDETGLLVGTQSIAILIAWQRDEGHSLFRRQLLDAGSRPAASDQELAGIRAQVDAAAGRGKLIDALFRSLFAAQLDFGDPDPVAAPDHQVNFDLVGDSLGPVAPQLTVVMNTSVPEVVSWRWKAVHGV